VILCVAANPSIDKLIEVEHIVPGTIHRPASLIQVPGGKGLNVARSAHALGAQVHATGILGGHAGRWTAEALEAEGVPGTFVWVEAETRSSLSVADRATGGLTEFYERGQDVGGDGWAALEDVVRSLLAGRAWMTMSGNLPPGAPDDGYARLIELARAAGVRTALDARERALAEGLDARPHLVKVNAEEAGWLLGAEVGSIEEAGRAAVAVRERLAGGAALVTCGADGALAAGPDGGLVHGRLYVRGSYPVGSGDAFLGGLVTALERGDGWEEAIALALGAATANAEMRGAARLDPARAAELAGRAVLVPA
jgi:1-phosphofructokinase family hexose kinase